MRAALIGAAAALAAAAPARADFFGDVRRTFEHDIPRAFTHDIPRAFGAEPKQARPPGGSAAAPRGQPPRRAAPSRPAPR